MNRKILEKMLDIRSNNLNVTTLIDDMQSPEFLTTLMDEIRKYSRIFANAQLIPGKMNSRYVFQIEDDANAIQLLDNDNISTGTEVVVSWECTPKPLGIGLMVPKLTSIFLENNSEETIENTLTNIFYRPFVKAIEKCVISGSYFDKSLFSNPQTIASTKDFDGLLQLVRELKNTMDDGMILGNPAVINEIVDTIDKEAYLNEYLLKETIEGVPIISTRNCPENVDDKFLVGFDTNKICLLLVPQLQVRKLSTAGSVDSFFQIFGFVNGGDIFGTAIALEGNNE
jgi:hypothetical protein